MPNFGISRKISHGTSEFTGFSLLDLGFSVLRSGFSNSNPNHEFWIVNLDSEKSHSEANSDL